MILPSSACSFSPVSAGAGWNTSATFCAGVIDPIEHQAVQVNVQVGGGAKALDEGDGAGGGCATFDAHLLDQMRRNHPVDDLQYRCEQFGVDCEEAAQRDRKRQHPLPHRHFGDDAIDHGPAPGDTGSLR